jgi:hypothetical protein
MNTYLTGYPPVHMWNFFYFLFKLGLEYGLMIGLKALKIDSEPRSRADNS